MGNTTVLNDPDSQALATGKNVSFVYTIDPTTNKPYGISGGGGGGGGAVTDLSVAGTLTAAQPTEQSAVAGGTVSLNLGTGQSSWKAELVALAGFTSATTIVVDGTVDGTNWIAKGFKVAGSLTTTTVQSVVGPGPIEITGNCAGLQKIRIRCSVLNSGESITVTLFASVGVGDIGLTSSIPAGQNNIGGVEIIDGAGTNKLAIDGSGKIGINSLPSITEANSASINTHLANIDSDSASIVTNTTGLATHTDATTLHTDLTTTNSDLSTINTTLGTLGTQTTAAAAKADLDTIAGAISSSKMQANMAQIGGIATQMSNSDGVSQLNMLEHALGLYSTGPVDSTGKPQSQNFDRIRSVQGKTRAGSALNITSTLAGDANLVFGSAPKTIMPGQAIQLSVNTGAAVETVYVSNSYTISSSATSIPLQAAVVNAGSTTARWDIFSATGSGMGVAMTSLGLLPVVMIMEDTVTAGEYYTVGTASNDGNGRNKSPLYANGIVNSAGSLDIQRGNIDSVTLINASAVTTTQTGGDQTNFNGRGVIVTLDMTNAGTGSVTLEIDMKDPVSGKYVALLTGVAVTSNSTNLYTVYPGGPATANVAANSPLPRTWRIKVTANNANATTYTCGASIIL